MRNIFKILLIIIPIFFIGRYVYFKIYFSPENIKERQIKTWNKRTNSNTISKDSVFSNDIKFIQNSILKGKYDVDLKYFKSSDNCPPQKYKIQDLIDEFEGFQNVGDIDKDGKDDFVFILRAINFCEEGNSYYFSNPNIPRILTESNCCHPDSIFSIGDIDEDGSNEIAQYYSGCASRYKHFNIWTFKNNQWKEITEINFCLNDKYEQFKDFHKLYKKVSKNKFQFLEISDVLGNGEIVKEWKTIEMN